MTAIKYENIWKSLNKYNFEIDPKLISDLTCAICKKIVKDCRQSLCGCRYCCECIEDYLGEQDKLCPGSTEECRDQYIDFSIDIQIDHVANMKVSRIVVKCPESDCQHRDELRYIEDHINSHNVNCPYFEVGCDKAGLTNINIDDHLNNNGLSHCKLFLNSLQQLKNEIVLASEDSRKRITTSDKLQNEMDNLTDKNIHQSKMIEKLKSDISNLSNELNLLKTKVREKEELAKNLSQELERRDVELENKFDGLKRMVETAKDEDFRKCQSSIISTIPLMSSQRNMAPFRWKMTNFFEKRNFAHENYDKSILSDPFYSHKGGYKLCLSVWPNGSVACYWKYLSAGFHLMMGEHDDKLEWPMKLTVTIALIDQESNDFYLFEKFNYNSSPDKYKCCFHRPKTSFNQTRSKTCFINVTSLISNERLLRNDSLIFECVVDG